MTRGRFTDNLRLYLPYFAGRRCEVALSVLLILIQTASLLPIAILVRRLFDYSLPRADVGELVTLLSLTMVLFTLNALATVGNRHVTLVFVKSGIHALRTDLVRRALASDCRYYSEEDLDRVHTRIVQDSERLDWMVSALLTQSVPGTLVSFGLSAFLAYLNPLLFLVIVAAMGAGFLVGRRLGAGVKRRTQTFHADFALFSKSILFLLKFNELVKLSAAEETELRNQNAAIERLRNSSQGLAWLGTAHSVMQNYLLTVGGIIVLLIGGLQAMNLAISIGSLLSFYIVLGLLGNNARIIIGALPTVIEGLQSMESLAPLLREEPRRRSGKPFTGFTIRIDFEGVHFRHDPHFALAGIDLTISKGEVVGLYGDSGSGKTTLVNLLLGLYEPEQGTIRVDRTDLRDIDRASYRGRIGTLTQDPALFHGTIRDNLVYGLGAPDDDQVVAACQAAGIHDYICGLDAGYETLIGERGVKLSGGQRQRIAIARALLRRPQILILDEPENNLDDATTLAILKNVRSSGVTTVVVSHNRDLRPHIDRAYEFIEAGPGIRTVRQISPAESGPPLVSVILPVFNAEKYLADAVKSVLGQSYAPIELICVNDGSSDGTLDILKSFGEHIVLVDCAENSGIAAARNQGMRIARGEVIAFIDADDLWEPDKLTIQMHRLKANPGLDLSFTQMQCFISPELSEEVKALRDCPPDPIAGYVAASAVIRRAALEKVGFFDPNFRVGEFIDWFARAKKAALSYELEGTVLLHRRIHETNTGVTQRASRIDYVKAVRQALQRRRRSS